MHLQQTKAKSRKSGGPQYYFHDLPAHVKEFLRKRGSCPVVLQTRYGIIASDFTAVGRYHKISGKQTVTGNVEHDRIVGGPTRQSIGEAIRHWYGLRDEGDFERIDVEVTIHEKGHFILIPTAVKMRNKERSRAIEKVSLPLSFHHDYQSKVWRENLDTLRGSATTREGILWAAAQIARVVADNQESNIKNVLECDLLRASGALSKLGLQLSAYLCQGYDCMDSRFQFTGLPEYPCPVEIKKRSTGFNYQMTRYKELPRAVVLCMEHNFVNPPEHIDIIELPALAKYLVG